MAVASRTFRIFVSSTFEDLEAERNALHEHVYPRLRAFCAERNARFQAIDLRWGVSTEASLDQQAMPICLAEIARCHEVTPRPNFLVLLGNRYGWRPPPAQIPQEELDRVRERVPAAKQHLLDWYRLDENARPPECLLRPRTEPPDDDGGDYTRTDPGSPWGPVERELHAVLAAAAGELGLDAERRLAYTASATEQEIRAGALSGRAAPDQAFCLFREIVEPYPDPAAARDPIRKYVDADQTELRALKETLRDKLPRSAITEYEVGWGVDRPGSGHLMRLVEDALELLRAAIENELGDPLPLLAAPSQPPRFGADKHLDDEGREHRRFAEERSRVFEGREAALDTIAGYLDGDDACILVVHGEGGTGKSALLAEAIRRAQERAAHLVYRFVGATPDSSRGRELLRSLCLELARRYEGDEAQAAVPDEYHELSRDFRERLERAGQAQALLLFVDSLDQLSAADGSRSLSWLPMPLPAGVRVVVSTRPGDTLEPLRGRGARLLALGPLSREDGETILDRWLADAHRRLQPRQRDAVLDGFVASAGNPLWLRLAFEEARRWRHDDEPEELAVGIAPGGAEEAAVGAGILAVNTFPRLIHEHRHGEVLVGHALGYLAASRHGLAEDELLDLLASDRAVYGWFLRGSHHVPPDLRRAAARQRGLAEDSPELGAWLNEIQSDDARLEQFLADILPEAELSLPVVLWARLLADLRPYLTERSAEGGTLIDFYHRELDEVAAAVFLAGEERRACHLRLADYFRRRADPQRDGSWAGESVRGLSELPYHLTEGAGEDDARWQELTDTLTDFRFLERKAAEVGIVGTGSGEGERVTYTGVFQLQDDYALALARMPGGSGGGRDGRRRIIVTGVDFHTGDGYVLRCPHCNTVHRLDEDFEQDPIGREISCPNPDCLGPLKVNDFLVPRRGR